MGGGFQWISQVGGGISNRILLCIVVRVRVRVRVREMGKEEGEARKKCCGRIKCDGGAEGGARRECYAATDVSREGRRW